ncbi:MAG: LytR family transcriptional regulator [Actinobacteria bacterium]|jgi:LCP family protein required for cell wall assembly|nr:MAG: LytR family transcriptional regulator [Actinomycetota bacterium]
MKRQERLKARKRKKRQTVIKVALALLLIGGLVVGIMNFDAVKTWASKHYFRLRWQDTQITPEEEVEIEKVTTPFEGETLNVLFIGIDRGSVAGEEGYTRSDVMILASVNVKKKKAVLVSFPRDTRVTIPGYGTEKINAAHSFNGPAGAVEIVEELSGMEINDYAEVDFVAFENIVDAIGGVTLHLDYPILDPKVGALPKGDVFLNGEDALILVRSRDLPRGDLDRIDNQKKFLKAVMQKAVEVRDLQALLKILDAAVMYLDTTLDPDTIFALAEALQGMQVEDVEFVTLPGDEPDPAPGQPWYYIPDEEAAAELFYNIENYCSILSPEEQAAEETKQQQQEKLSETDMEVDRSRVRLAVLNGVRWEGMAAQVAEVMEGKGYQGIATGNTVNPYEATTVYYAPGHEEEARRVAKDLNSSADYVIEEDADVAITYDADIILVIGKDYVNK